jgi:hypothetical protein
LAEGLPNDGPGLRRKYYSADHRAHL